MTLKLNPQACLKELQILAQQADWGPFVSHDLIAISEEGRVTVVGFWGKAVRWLEHIFTGKDTFADCRMSTVIERIKSLAMKAFEAEHERSFFAHESPLQHVLADLQSKSRSLTNRTALGSLIVGIQEYWPARQLETYCVAKYGLDKVSTFKIMRNPDGSLSIETRLTTGEVKTDREEDCLKERVEKVKDHRFVKSDDRKAIEKAIGEASTALHEKFTHFDIWKEPFSSGHQITVQLEGEKEFYVSLVLSQLENNVRSIKNAFLESEYQCSFFVDKVCEERGDRWTKMSTRVWQDRSEEGPLFIINQWLKRQAEQGLPELTLKIEGDDYIFSDKEGVKLKLPGICHSLALDVRNIREVFSDIIYRVVEKLHLLQQEKGLP